MTRLPGRAACCSPPSDAHYGRSCTGPAQAGYSAQILLLGVFSTLFGSYAASGELRRHRALGRFTLWLSLAVNWVYTGLCFWESWIAAGESKPSLKFAFCWDC